DCRMQRWVKNNGGGAGRRFTPATIMRNMKVLAIDQTTRAAEDEKAVVGATATLAVSERDAELLALARSEGDLSLVLRSYADTAGPSGHVPGAVRRGSERTGAVVKVYGGGDAQEVARP